MDDLIVRLSRKRFFRTQWFEPAGEIDVPVPADMAEWDGVESENVNPDGPAAVARIAALEAENASLKAQLATIEAETLERAAKVADDWPDNAISKQAVWRIATAIRNLKNKDTDHDQA